MDNKDLFAAPTKDELHDLYAAPSPEELEAIKSSSPKSARELAEQSLITPENIQDAKAALSGGAQGLTFGFSDELGAGGDVALDALKNGDLSDLPTKWRKYQKSREAANKADQMVSPNAYMAGEIGGGILGAVAAPELGGAKLVAGAGKLSPAVAKFLAGQGGGLATKMAGKGAAGLLEGAPIGALYGAGSSEADLSKPAELGMDVVSGAGMGSLTGAALSAGAATGKHLLNETAPSIVNNSDFLRKMKEAYKFGKKGVNLSSTEGQDVAALASKNIPNKIVNQIMEVDGQLGQKVGASLDMATQNGVKINIDPQIQQSTMQLFNEFSNNPSLMGLVEPKSAEVIKKIYQGGMGDLNPVEARAIKDSLYDLTDKLAGLNSDTANLARQQGTKLARSIDEQIKSSIPEYKKAAEQFANFRASVPETILQPGIPMDKRSAYLGNLKNKEESLFKATQSMFGDAQLPGSSVTGGARVGLKELQQNLRSLGRTNPEAVQAMGGSPDKVFQGLREKADQMAMLKQSQGVDPHQGLKKTMLGQIVGGGEGMALNVSNKLGRAAKMTGQSAPVKVATQVFQAADDQLMGLAQKLKSNKSAESIGSALEKALNNKDETLKNAVLFRMMQDPNYRELLKSEGYSDGMPENK